jgi:NADH:ubiquinone oxidoreductase subunit 6 (subunit J)
MVGAREDRRLLKISIAFPVGLVAIGVIIANIRYLDLGEGSQGSGPEIREITLALVYALAVIWVVVFMIYLLRRKPGGRTQSINERGKNNYFVPLVIIGVLILASLMVNQGQISIQNQTSPSPDPGSTPNDNNNNPLTSDSSGRIGALYILIGVLAIALAFVALKYNRSTPLRFRKAQLSLAQQNVTETICQATKDLYSGEDPRSVIVRTYQQMSRLLSDEGRSLKPLTPREVAQLAERDLSWPDGPLVELTSLFEEAWYSQHVMGETERNRALRAFEAIVSEDKGRRPELGRTYT